MAKSNTNVNINDLLLPEVLRKISSQITPTRKRDMLLKFRDTPHHPALMTLFILIYDWSIEFSVPDGIPPNLKLNRVPVGTEHTYLRTEYSKLQHLVVNPANVLAKSRTEQIYIQLLENLHHTEAQLLLRIINRCVFKDWGTEKKYNIPFSLVQSVYPEIIWFNRGNGKEPEKYDPFVHLKDEVGSSVDDSITEEHNNNNVEY